jgi:hypothetical protein
VPGAGALELALCFELRQGVVAHGLEKSVAGTLGDEERLRCERSQSGEHDVVGCRLIADDDGGRVGPEGAGEHTQPAKRRLLVLRQQVVAPADRGREGLMVRLACAPPAGEQT